MLIRCFTRLAGGRYVGKTCLNLTFGENKFPERKDLWSADGGPLSNRFMTFNGEMCRVICVDDLCFRERLDYFRNRDRFPISVIIVVYGVDSRKSFDNARYEWIPDRRMENPTIPIVLVANKIDLRDSGDCETISSAEGFRMAKEMGASYREVSCLRNQGVQELFQHVLELAILNLPEVKELLDVSCAVIPPVKPPPAPEPIIQAAPSTYTSDGQHTLSHPIYHDITFLVEGERRIFAHRIILCATSSFFRKIFSFSGVADGFDRDEFNPDKIQESHLISGIQKIYDTNDGKEITIELDTDIKAKTLVKLLEFLYTGCLSERLKHGDICELKRVAYLFELDHLVSGCDKAMTDQESEDQEKDLIISEDYLMEISIDEKDNALADFMRQGILSDVVFDVKGSQIPAHRVVVCTRSPWLAALVDSGLEDRGSRLEISISDVSVKDFMSFLEYLYTDHAHLDDSSDVIGLLSFADMIGAHRLVSLCELHFKKEIDTMLERVWEGEVINALELLKKFEACKATQMVGWCRHYICHNYAKFLDKEEFLHLTQDDQDYFKQHRWPPVNYILDMEDFERRLLSINFYERKYIDVTTITNTTDSNNNNV